MPVRNKDLVIVDKINEIDQLKKENEQLKKTIRELTEKIIDYELILRPVFN